MRAAARLRVLLRADPGSVRADRRHAALLAAGRPDLIIYAAFRVVHRHVRTGRAARRPAPAPGAGGRDPLHPGLRPIVERSVHRVLGTFVGLAVTASLLLPGPDPSWSALAVIVLLFPTELFMARHYWLALGFFTPLIMVMTELAAPGDPAAMVVARTVDTVVGVVAGVGAAVVVRGPCQGR